MAVNVLVTYASATGTTAEVAQAVAAVLTENAVQVDVRPIKAVDDLSSYDGVVIGSAIRAGQWLPEAIGFLNQYKDDLQAIPVAFFTVCMTLCEDTAQNREKVNAYMQLAYDVLMPIASGLFAGRMDLQKLSLPMRTVMRMNGAKTGDFRDWAVIRSWAKALKPRLLAAAVAP
jgi:menaquinone-dependent protoporphyrinogen oxidase